MLCLMYRNFFSLSELPFSISPDPKYLFMSDRHKEALAHLTHGLGGGSGGFALLTGEVGTGKTTISRCLMQQLPDNTQTAFILNPTLSSRELLATLCDELKIRYRKSDASLKTLTDKIAEKLLKNHENDINTLLIIDEAQHLQPEVLEQLRLLTNLETNTKKLLQVILIGQPELQQLLQRRDLRQLAQRITARYHLMPLTKQELAQYVSHRLLIADCTRALFDQGALAKIHQLSTGIPRLINLLCHSALMTAYNQNDSVVNKKIVLKAAEHALGSDLSYYSNKNQSSTGYSGHNNMAMKFTAGISVLALISVFSLTMYLWKQDVTEKLVVENNTVKESAPTQEIKSDDKPIQSWVPSEQTSVPLNVLNEELTEDEELVVISAESPVNSQNNALDGKHELTSKTLNDETLDEEVVEVLTQKKEKRVTQKNNEITVDEVSQELLTLFQAAVDDTPTGSSANKPNVDFSDDVKNDLSNDFTENRASVVQPLTQMPVWVQNGVPSLQFEQHIYSSDGEGWVTVNGRDRYQGDMITKDLQVTEILPQKVILRYRGETFSLPALTNW